MSHTVPCPECGSTRGRTTNTRLRGEYVYRRKQCDAGHRFSTVEIVSTVMGNPRGSGKISSPTSIQHQFHDLRLHLRKQLLSIIDNYED